jgi:hypothetical protein
VAAQRPGTEVSNRAFNGNTVTTLRTAGGFAAGSLGLT